MLTINLYIGILLAFLVNIQAFEKRGYTPECTPQQLTSIAAADVTHHTSCPQRNWMPFMTKSSKNKKFVTYISVGCNKGDDFVAMMEALSQNKSYNVVEYQKQLNAVRPGLQNEVCGLTQKIRLPDEASSPERPIRGYCIEPVDVNYNLLTTMAAKMGFDTSAYNLVYAAADAFPGKTMFATGTLGITNVSIDAKGTVPTEVINIDTFVKDKGISEIDLIQIDAEGYDARVITGALVTLATIPVHFLEFEYHSNGKWSTTDLSWVFDILDVLHFNCFWEGSRGELWRGTGCFHPNHHLRRYWSNLICVNRVLEPKAEEEFMALASKYL